MGDYITLIGEKKLDDKWVAVDEPLCILNEQTYGWFGWLAGIRNYSAIGPVVERRGLPDDASREVTRRFEDDYDAFAPSYLTVDELLAVDYERTVENRRCTINGNGGSTCEPGLGELMSLREFLSQRRYDAIHELPGLEIERIVFWFH